MNAASIEQPQQSHDDEPMSSRSNGHASINEIVVTILGIVVGGACLALGSAFQRMTLLTGIAVLLMSSVMSWFALLLITKACVRSAGAAAAGNRGGGGEHQNHTFVDLVQSASSSALLVNFFRCGLFLFPLGICTAFMKVIGESMPAIVKFLLLSRQQAGSNQNNHNESSSSTTTTTVIIIINNNSAAAETDLTSAPYFHEWFWMMIAVSLLAPLSSIRQMSELSKLTFVGIVTVMFAGVVVIVRFVDGTYTVHYSSARMPSHCVDWYLTATNQTAAILHSSIVAPSVSLLASQSSSSSWSSYIEGFFVAVSTITMALACHNNGPTFVSELRNRSEARMAIAVKRAAVFAIIFYLAVGLASYLIFGSALVKAHGNVLNCMSWQDELVFFARVAITLHFFTVLPINAISCRKVLNAFLFPGVEEATLSFAILFVEAVVLVAASALIAYSSSGIEQIFSLIGAMFGINFTLTLPAFCYMRLVNPCHLSELAAVCGGCCCKTPPSLSTASSSSSSSSCRNHHPHHQHHSDDGNLAVADDKKLTPPQRILVVDENDDGDASNDDESGLHIVGGKIDISVLDDNDDAEARASTTIAAATGSAASTKRKEGEEMVTVFTTGTVGTDTGSTSCCASMTMQHRHHHRKASSDLCCNTVASANFLGTAGCSRKSTTTATTTAAVVTTPPLSPRGAPAPSSPHSSSSPSLPLVYRMCVHFMMWWGIVASICSFIFSLSAFMSGDSE